MGRRDSMKNKYFDIKFNPENGTITSIVNIKDEHKMNWCIEDAGWGSLQYVGPEDNSTNPHETSVYKMSFKAFEETDDFATSVYENDTLRVSVNRFFANNGNYTERYTVKNLSKSDYFLEHGNLGIFTPFNDIYTCAEDCMTSRCNTHIWCGGNTTYINALKMGVSEINLGLALTEGSIKSYSVNGTKSNHRGVFLLNPEHFELLPNEEYVIEWQMFWHSGTDDFYKKLSEYTSYVEINAPQFTVFDDESINFNITTKLKGDISVLCDGNDVPFEKEENGCKVSYSPKRLGEHRFDIRIGHISPIQNFSFQKT